MVLIDHEAEYNNRRRVPEVVEISAGWQAASDAYRQTADAELDLPYGPGERQRYDLFRSGLTGAPTVVYIHGGYWQMGDRKLYSFVARALNESGLDVAIPSYSLCPAVSVLEIVNELRSCLAAIWKKLGTRPLLVGHSAGGHLTTAMLATDWSTVPGVPSDLLHAGIAISGVYELEPLVHTSINGALGLDLDSARAASPRLWPAPPSDRSLVAAVGGAESSEFKRQAHEMTEHWQQAGLRTEYLELPGANHFTVLEPLTRPDSELFARVLAGAAANGR